MCLCQPLPSLTLCCSFFFAQCSRVWKKVQLHIWIICEVFEHFFSQVTLEESQLHYCSIFCTALWFCPLASARMIATQSLSLSLVISFHMWFDCICILKDWVTRKHWAKKTICTNYVTDGYNLQFITCCYICLSFMISYLCT